MSDSRPQLRRTTPLVSISAIVIDTETTGLNTQSDRIVQIGAVAMRDGKLDFDSTFDVLVNPGIPIPPASTEIHHINDEDVKGAETFEQAIPKLDAFFNAPLWIGYSIGFDLAVMKAEHERAGLDWSPPPSLDLQHLGQLVVPNLPNRSLETLAVWLKVPTDNRHNALGDAIMTARVFKALVPKLAEKDIFTFAAAKRASNRISTPGASENGWADIRDEGALRVRNVSEYARIDSYPYRHRVSEIMNSPPKTVKPKTTLAAAMKQLMDDNISSLFVVPEKAGKSHGIITERDVLRAIANYGPGALKKNVDQYCTRPLMGIGEDEFIYKAISRMSSLNVRHLAVFDSRGKLAGVITSRDLLQQRSGEASILGDNIEQANSAEELATIWPSLAETARGLVYEQVDPRNIAAIISRELRALTRRACELSIEEMAEKGRGKPPVQWAMMVLGSGGRGESLLAMDQDNAIIFEKGEPGGKTDRWFEEMGTRATMILHHAGVPLCDGNIMASNLEWRMSRERWRKNVQHWISRSNPQDIINSDIFFDASAVAGNEELLRELELDALEAASKSRNFIQLLSMNAADFPTVLGWFNKIKTENGRVDLKRAGLMPIFSAARVLALKHRIALNSTPQRLEAVKELEPEKARTLENLTEAHRIFLEIILKQQLRDLDAGLPLSNSISPTAFSGFELEEIRWALNETRAVSDVLGVGLTYA